MLRNFLTIALRNLVRNKVSSFINVGGLAVGMAVAMLIGLWMHDELSFDRTHQQYDRLGQVWTTWYSSQEPSTGNAIAVPLAGELRTKYASDFKRVALASWNFGHILAYGDKKLSQEGTWAEAELPDMLTLRMVKGSRRALRDPSSVLLTASLARALFGNDEPLDKIIRLDNTVDLTVGGVYEDLPRNASFHVTKFFLAWDKYLTVEPWVKKSETEWSNHSFRLFVEMQPGVDFDRVTAKIKDVPMRHLKAAVDGRESVVLHPMARWHLYSDFKNGVSAGGGITFVWLFGTIGAFVLLLACINFMNLATARSEKRAKEVGVRKAIGSARGQLVAQFLSESLLVTGLALVLALGLVVFSLPWFNQVADKQMTIPWSNPAFWLAVLSFSLFTGLVAGSYPAFYLSSFDAVRVLKGTFRTGRLAALPRQVLVVVQFTVSVTLIIGTLVVHRQIEHAKNRPVGYDRTSTITVMINTPDLRGKYVPLRDDLIKTGAVQNVAQSSSPTTDLWSNQNGFTWRGKDPNTIPSFGMIGVTHDFGATIGWQLRAGRDFSRAFGTDTSAIILNEAAAKLMGFKNPIGEMVQQQRGPTETKSSRVIGVVKDLVMQSPFEPVKPTLFVLSYEWANMFTVRLKPGQPTRDALAKVEKVFKKYNPGSPFEYKFTDEEYAQKFSSESRVGSLASVFAGLAILISCLGLFGLASFTAEQRTKEIGVRKVLGASVVDLWLLLSKDFVRLVLVSLVIAMPVAWWFMQRWLFTYPYRATLPWWIFAAAGGGAVLITLATVSYQAIKAALANPVRSLRTE